ncbi:enoyl-CoA hydratase [Mycobacterium avium subsp. hominissuis TH135]|nr:enoyl-CoA hydratase [Mycobacterium avium subsp. hominissuis TH135]
MCIVESFPSTVTVAVLDTALADRELHATRAVVASATAMTAVVRFCIGHLISPLMELLGPAAVMLFSAHENANIGISFKEHRRMVDLEIDDGLAVVTIDRPNARNAISLDTMDQLEKALDAAAGAQALVIKGAGERAFVSGGDLKELSALRTEEDAAAMARRMRSICDQLAEFPAPVIAALNGHAFGGGAEVAVAADIRVAADDIKIAFNQVELEIMPAWGGAERLAALVGQGRALLLTGTGNPVDAVDAQRIGLVDVVLPRSSFDEGWRSIATKLARHPANEIKRIIRGVSADEAIAAFARLWVADAHWQAADRVMNRNAKPRPAARGAK